ncbi:MAG: RDD family protein [Clostridiales bacterium]|nr:RDD family protein [Clostridiales bacterium]
MNTIKITTPDNIELEYTLAGVGARFAALILDLLAQFIVCALLFAVLYLTARKSGKVLNFFYDMPGWFLALAIILLFAIFFGYFIISELAFNGQSLGKKILGLRVIRENGQPLALRHSLIRNILRYFVDMLGVGALMIFCTRKCKRVGDIAASTIVVNERPNTQPLTYAPLTRELKA